jgi:hypothetical protein
MHFGNIVSSHSMNSCTRPRTRPPNRAIVHLPPVHQYGVSVPPTLTPLLFIGHSRKFFEQIGNPISKK